MKTLINIKADKEVKEKAQRVAGELGLPLSTVINAYLKEFIRSKEVVFSVIPKMTSALEELVGRAEEDLRKNRNISPVFTSAKEAIKYLNS